MTEVQKTVTLSVDQTKENYSEYLLRCIQLILNSADEGKLAVVDCYDMNGEVVPVICAMLEDSKSVFPVSQLFRQDQEPSALLTPVATRDAAAEAEPESEGE